MKFKSSFAAQSAYLLNLEDTFIWGEKVAQGKISLDYVKKTIRLILIGERNNVETFVATITESENLSNGESIFQAKHEAFSITVRDMTNVACRIKALSPTMVVLKTGNGPEHAFNFQALSLEYC